MEYPTVFDIETIARSRWSKNTRVNSIHEEIPLPEEGPYHVSQMQLRNPGETSSSIDGDGVSLSHPEGDFYQQWLHSMNTIISNGREMELLLGTVGLSHGKETDLLLGTDIIRTLGDGFRTNDRRFRATPEVSRLDQGTVSTLRHDPYLPHPEQAHRIDDILNGEVTFSQHLQTHQVSTPLAKFPGNAFYLDESPDARQNLDSRRSTTFRLFQDRDVSYGTRNVWYDWMSLIDANLPAITEFNGNSNIFKTERSLKLDDLIFDTGDFNLRTNDLVFET